MPAGTSQWTESLDLVCNIAALYSGVGSGRVYKGYVRWAESTNLEQLITSGNSISSGNRGWFFAHLDMIEKRSDGNVPAIANFELKAGLLVYVPKDVSDDLNAAWDICGGLVSALATPAYYSGSLSPARVSAKWGGLEVIETGGIARFDFGAWDRGGAIEFVDP